MGIGAAIGGGLSLAGGFMKSRAAGSAGNQMAGGNLAAAMLQAQLAATTQQNFAPFMEYGQNAFRTLAPLIGVGGDPMSAELTSRFAPTMERLEQTPGYQFTLNQGLKGVQNAFAAKGLGSSGNALRGAADYAAGLASQTFQQQFGNYWGENKSIYDMLAGAGNVGLSAAGSSANALQGFSRGIADSLSSAGNAQGQATLAGANSLFNGIGNAYGLLNAGAGPSSIMNRSVSDFFNFSPFPKGNYF